MRKFVVVAALATFAVGLVAGCTTETPSTPAATTAAADTTTKAVCTEALAYNTTAFASVSSKYTELMAAITAKDEAKLDQLATEGQAISDAWVAKLNELIAKKPKAEVVKELNDMLALINSDENVTPETMLAQFTKESGELTAACA